MPWGQRLTGILMSSLSNPSLEKYHTRLSSLLEKQVHQ
ncbi:unnamed protein product [Spirodela intermedia]|uniref:Uncharacterized protein n=1 Tax=Spirodela intermedia TaxID=51605 RepID=A0A7I8JCU7_SPIIN|nr:unnamed protein product [Spirodela intermedia]CAA6667811.1 unnamed protein product [Spirodela intermedia]